MTNIFRAFRYELQMWLLAAVRGIPGYTGCALRNLVIPYEHGTNVTVWDRIHFDSPWKIEIGSNVSINRGCILTATGGISIGDHVLIGPNVVIYTQNHRYDGVGPIARQGFTFGKVTLEDHVWLGANVVILPGVTIGAGSIVGAGAVVTADIAPDTLAVGNPARPIRRLHRDLNA